MESVAFRDAALDKNIQAVRRGYEDTKVFDATGKEIS
jgi:pyruvate ferredoxin oxidoreductase gamma subunit/phenylglyoxylate dehydrogenase gamma subunit